MTRKLAALALLVAILSMQSASAEQLSKIAVVSFERVVENFPSGSPAFSRLRILKEEYEERTQEHLERLNELERNLLGAKESGTQLRVASLEREIEDFKSFIRQWQEIKLKEIEIVQNDFLRGDDIARGIYRAIEYIAVNEGYTLVLDDRDTDIVWYSNEVDITDLIIHRLRALAR